MGLLTVRTTLIIKEKYIHSELDIIKKMSENVKQKLRLLNI